MDIASLPQPKIQIIELSNSGINGISTLLSVIVFIAFLAFTLSTATRLYNKMNPNARYKDPNIINAITQNTMETVQYLMGGIVENKVDNEIVTYQTGIDNLSKAIKNSTDTADKIAKLINALNQNILDNFRAKINKFNTFFENTQSTATKIGNAMNNLNKKYTASYEKYQSRLKAYVDNLKDFASKIADQITKATAIPSLFNMIAPLKKIYNSIIRTFTNNQAFIKEHIDSGFVIPKDDYNATAQTNLNTGFNASKSILTMGGYK